LPSPSVSCWQRLVVLEDSVVIFRFIFVPFFFILLLLYMSFLGY
jgi:hypothetical protein